jgi:hypothetical protein|tara:strand:- start:5861 stop:6130 length:270 start_codon:yes stop_codon:yes gene_type:complete
MADKKREYIMGTFKEKVFDNGGSIIKCAISVDDLYKKANSDGWIHFDIKQRKEVGEKGQTHYAEVDTWKPNTNQDAGPPTQKEEDDLPF